MTSGVITNDASQIFTTSSNNNPQMSLQSLNDGIFAPFPLSGSPQHCYGTQDSFFTEQITISLSDMTLIETVLIVDNESNATTAATLSGAQLKIGDRQTSTATYRLCKQLTKAGIFTCSMVGLKINLSTTSSLNICQIRAYSWQPDPSSSIFYYTTSQVRECGDNQTVKLFTFPQPTTQYPWLDGYCYPFKNLTIFFNTVRYVHVFLFLGSNAQSFTNSVQWNVQFYDSQNSLVHQSQYATDLDKYGREIIVQKLVSQIRISVTGSDLWLLYAASFSTPTDCSEAFVWQAPSGDIVFYVDKTPKVESVQIKATVNAGACPIAHEAFQANGLTLPSFITYDLDLQTFKIQINDKTVVGTYSVKVRAIYGYTGGVSNKRQNFFYSNIIIKCATGFWLTDANQTQLTVKINQSYQLPQLSHAPPEANVDYVFQSNSEIIQITGNNFSVTNPFTGQQNVQYQVTDTISAITQSFTLILTYQLCMSVQDFQMSSTAVVLDAINPSAQITYQAEFLDSQCSFSLTYARQVVTQASFENRQSTIPRDDGIIYWADTKNFSLPVTIQYDVQIAGSPHSLNGYFRDLKSNTSQLGWQISTEGTNVMFFNNLASNTLLNVAAQSLSPMQTNRTYSVKVVIASDRAELYLDGALYYYCTYSPGQILTTGRVGFERQERGTEFGSSQISNFHHLYENPQIIQVSISPPSVNFLAIPDPQIYMEENVVFTMTDSDSSQSSSQIVNVKKTNPQCKVTSIVFAAQITTPLVCQLHQQCSFQLPTVQQTPSCDHPIDVYLYNDPNDEGLHSHSFVSYTQATNTITAQSASFADIGQHSFIILASWYYDSNVRVAVPFQVNMVCSDAEFAFASQVGPQSYLVYEQLQVTLPIDQCKNELDYEVQIMSYSGASFVSVSGNIATIYSTDPDIAGSYTLTIVARKKSNPAQTLSQNFSLSVECQLNSLSFDLEATPSQVNLVEQKVQKLPLVTIKGNGCPTPAISFTTSFAGQGITIVNVVDTNAKLRFNADSLVHMETYSIGVAVSFDSKEFTHTYAVQVIKCGAPMTAEPHNFSLAAFVGLPIKFLLPTLNDTLQRLKSDQNYCGASTVSVTGDILNVAQFDPATQRLDVPALTNDKRGLYSGSYQRVFSNLTLTLPISVFVQQSMVFQGSQFAATFQLMSGSLALVYRDVTISAAAITQLKNQLDYLQPNDWFPELQRLQQNNLDTSELLMQSLFIGLAFTHKVSSSQSDFASVIKVKDSTAFSFYDEAYADVGRHQAFTQETTILRQGKPMGTISGVWGQVSVAFDFDCTTLKLLSTSAIPNSVVKVGAESKTLSFFDLTDQDGIIEKYPLKCGKQTYQLTMKGTDDPVPSFITLGPNAITISSNDKADVGTYEIDLKFTISQVSFRLPFQLTVTEDTSKLDPRAQINQPPVLKNVIDKQLPGTTCRVGEKCEIQLPEVVDPDGDAVSVKINMGHGELNAANVLQFDQSTNIVSLTLPSNFKDTSEMMYVSVRDSLSQTDYLMSIKIILQWEQKPTDKSPEKSEPSIELKKQDQLPEFLKELLNPQSLQDKQAIKNRAKTECVPMTTKVTTTGQVDFIFSGGVNLQMNKELLTKIKEAGSIQLQLIKADEGKLSEPTGFSWTFKQFNSFTIRMELFFDSAQQISATSYGRDTLRIVFLDTSQFINCDDIFQRRSLSPMPKAFEIFVTLPPQKQMLIREDGEAAPAEAPSGAEALTQSNAVQSTFTSSLIANYVFGLSSQMLWGGINAMQVICASALLQVTLPGNTQPLYSYIQSLTSFDFYNPIDTLSKWFGFSETDPYSNNFDSLGFGSINYYDSMGGLIIIIAVVTLFQALAPLLQCCKKKTQPYVRNKTGYICNVVFINVTAISIFKQDRFDVVNEWLRFLEEFFLDLLIAGVLSCHEVFVIEEKTHGDRFDIASGIVTLILCAGFTVFAFIYATCLSKRLIFKIKAEKNIERIKDIIELMENQQEKIAENLADDAFELSRSQLAPSVPENQLQNQEDVLPTERGLLDVEEIEIQVVDLSQLKFDPQESASNPSILSPQLLSQMNVANGVSVINVGSLMDESKPNKSIIKLKKTFTEGQGPLMPSKSQPINLYQDSQLVMSPKKSVQWFAPSLISALPLDKKAVSQGGASVDLEDVQIQIQDQESRVVSHRSMRPRRVRSAKSSKSHKPSFIDKESVLLRPPPPHAEKPDAQAPGRQLSQHSNPSFKSKRSRRRSTKKKDEKIIKMLELLNSNGPTGRIKFLEQQLDKQTKLLKAEQAKKPYWFNYEYAKIFHEDLMAGRVSTMMYHPFFLLRRALLLWAVFQFNDIPNVQCILFLVSSMIMVTYLVAAQPFESTKVNVIEILNESFVLLIAYYYLIMTQVTLNVEQMSQMGTVINSTIGVCLLGNLAMMLYETLQGLRVQLKKIFEFFRMRRRAKVQDGDEGVVSNRFFQISSRNKHYFAYYPIRDVPDEDDLNLLFDFEEQRELREYRRLQLLRTATKFQAVNDFVQEYGSEDDRSSHQSRISLRDHRLPERWSADFSSSRSMSRSRPNLPRLDVSRSDDSVFPSEIQIQLPGTDINEASRRNVDTPMFCLGTPIFNNPSPIAQQDIITMKQNSMIPLSSLKHREPSKQSIVSPLFNMRQDSHRDQRSSTLSQLLHGQNSSIRNLRQASSVRNEIFNQLPEESSSLASSIQSSFNTNKYGDESADFRQPDELTVNYYGDALISSTEFQDQGIASNLDISGGHDVVRETPASLMQHSADSLSEQSFSLLEIAEAPQEEEQDSNSFKNGPQTVQSFQLIECHPDQIVITTETQGPGPGQPLNQATGVVAANNNSCGWDRRDFLASITHPINRIGQSNRGPDIFKVNWYNRPTAHSVVTDDPDVQADEEAQHPQTKIENSKLDKIRVIEHDGDEPDVEDFESLKMESMQSDAVMQLDVVQIQTNPSRLEQDFATEQQRQSTSSGWLIVQAVSSYARSLMARQSAAQQESWSILNANNHSRQPSASALPANYQQRPDI